MARDRISSELSNNIDDEDGYSKWFEDFRPYNIKIVLIERKFRMKFKKHLTYNIFRLDFSTPDSSWLGYLWLIELILNLNIWLFQVATDQSGFASTY